MYWHYDNKYGHHEVTADGYWQYYTVLDMSRNEGLHHEQVQDATGDVVP